MHFHNTKIVNKKKRSLGQSQLTKEETVASNIIHMLLFTVNYLVTLSYKTVYCSSSKHENFLQIQGFVCFWAFEGSSP